MTLVTGRAALLAALTLISVAVLASVASATRQTTDLSEYRALVVASDLDDVIWARSIAHSLYNMGIQVDMSILYLNNDYPSARTERARLKDLGFLWHYDAVLIPDLNKLYTYGGRLRQEEIRALIRYTRGGHVLFMGMNTIVQNWHPLLEEAAGARIVGIASSMIDTSLYDIVYGGRVYSYNDTFDAVRLKPSGCQVIATFETRDPAITVNSYGRGVVVIAAFNPVKAVLNQYNGEEMAELMARVIAESLARASPGPLPASYKAREILVSTASKPLKILEDLAAKAGGGLLGATVAVALVAFTAYIVLLIASILCIVPRWARLVLVKPIAKYIPLNSLDSHIIEMIRGEGPLTLHEISMKASIHPRRLCWRLTLLEAKKHIVSIPVPEGTAYAYVEDLPLALLATNPLFDKIASLVLSEPGITVHEIAVRLSIPLDAALKACKELAAHGVIELRKVLVEYEAYPAHPLYNKLLYRVHVTQATKHEKPQPESNS